MTTRILVLGGYGTAGALLVRLLLEHSEAKVVVAGRSASKAEGLAAGLDAELGPRRCRAQRVDAADPRSLDAAFAAVDLVVVASSTLTYVRTAAAAAACLLQYLDGSIRRPGLSLQALAVEPGRFLTDLQKLGATVSVLGAPALAAR